MNELMENLVFHRDGKLWTNSLIIAEKFEKEHKTVLRSVEESNCSDAFSRAHFCAGAYKDLNGQERPMYYLTQMGFSWVALGFTGEKAAQWKEKFLVAFEQAMEKAMKPDIFEKMKRFNKNPLVMYAQQNAELLFNHLILEEQLEEQKKISNRHEVELTSIKKESKDTLEKIDDLETTLEYRMRYINHTTYGPGYGHIPKGTLQIDMIRKKYFLGVTEKVITAYLKSVLHPMTLFSYTDDVSSGRLPTHCWAEAGLDIRFKDFFKESRFIKETNRQYKFYHRCLETIEQDSYSFTKKDFSELNTESSEDIKIYVMRLIRDRIKTIEKL